MATIEVGRVWRLVTASRAAGSSWPFLRDYPLDSGAASEPLQSALTMVARG